MSKRNNRSRAVFPMDEDNSGSEQTPVSPANNNWYPQTFQDRIFVGSLQPEVTEDVLRSVFGKEGEIKDCKIVRENSTRSKGYGFVTFTNVATVEKILEREAGYYSFKGHPWNVSHATRRLPIQQPVSPMVLYPYSPPTGGMHPNMMYPYPVPGYFMPPPGSPYSGSPMNHQNQFMYPPPYAVAYYHPDMFPQDPQAEEQNVDKEGVEQA
uniref:RRM domain-containing protein n=1 Tax=Panagrolaimus sp. JU765 TaxID=591449 RepID=A0AC34R994_9BILA